MQVINTLFKTIILITLYLKLIINLLKKSFN